MYFIFIIRIFWEKERPSSTDSEDSEPTRRISSRAKIDPRTIPNHHKTITFTIIIVLISIILGLFILLIQVEQEKKLVTCPSCAPINETLTRQLESENERFAHNQNSCIDLLKTKKELELAMEQVKTMKDDARKCESEKQKYEKSFQETQKKFSLVEKQLNVLKIESKEQEGENKRYKHNLEQVLKSAEEKINASDKKESEIKEELRKLEKELKETKNKNFLLKSTFEAAREEWQSDTSRRSFRFKVLFLCLFVANCYFLHPKYFNRQSLI